MRLILSVLLAALIAISAGCGGQSGSAGGAASPVPADVAAYVLVDTTFQGDQWRAASELLARFPDGDGALEELLDDEELRRALGPESILAVLSGPPGDDGEPPAVLLTQPDDLDTFDRLLAGSDTARAEVRGWEVVARDQEVLDRYREALDGPSLESSDDFVEAMDGVPEDALARLYANGGTLLEALPQLSSELGQAPLGLLEDKAGGTIGAAVLPEGDGVRVQGQVVGADAPPSEAYASELVEDVPASAISFASFGDLGAALERHEGMLSLALGDVEALLGGETAVYLDPGGEATLVTQVEDEAAALETAKALLGLAGEDVRVAVDAFDGLLAVSTSEAELEELRGDGPRLAGDERFQEALAAAGIPAETAGFGWVDVRAAAPLYLEKAAGAGEYLEPLGAAVFWKSGSEDAQRFSLFLGID